MEKGSEIVLVAEDEDIVRRLAIRVLRGRGYTVLEAQDGRQAIRVAEHHQGPIHLLLTDVVMPEIDGRQLAELLGLKFPEMKIIFMSGYTQEIISQRAILAPGVNFLSKPFAPEDLARKVRETLDAPPKKK